MKEMDNKMEGKEKEGGDAEETGEIMERKLKVMEKKMERKEREEKMRNIVKKKVKMEEGKRREAVEGIFRDVEVEEVRRLKGDAEKGTEMLRVRLRKEEQRREVIMRKKSLRGRKERIVKDLTWGERKTKWRLEEIAREEKRREK